MKPGNAPNRCINSHANSVRRFGLLSRDRNISLPLILSTHSYKSPLSQASSTWLINVYTVELIRFSRLITRRSRGRVITHFTRPRDLSMLRLLYIINCSQNWSFTRKWPTEIVYMCAAKRNQPINIQTGLFPRQRSGSPNWTRVMNWHAIHERR